MIFTEMISSMEKKRSEVIELIRAQGKAELNRVEQLLKQLELEITDLKKRVTELEQLSHIGSHAFPPGSQCLSQTSSGIKAGYTLDGVPTHCRAQTTKGQQSKQGTGANNRGRGVSSLSVSLLIMRIHPASLSISISHLME
ncbi:uncharacterized protein LOC131346567 isoform X1 [Hemibagrus wyckioides]|uniref:uncharacterized protein LOC131346567 isoform X1 n=1 Tax=Hemibagrus wyckioides TaxID=337641 RepID=UPI00266B8377|nr:uncharacterized protein LOC131346567 isoform X1 [Hemibagrus wyckioides]